MAVAALVVVVSCGSPPSSTPTATQPATASASPTPTPVPLSTAAATPDELNAVASLLYPLCTPANCAGDAMFTTCGAGSSGTDVFALCPLTVRLLNQLKADVAGVPSAPDPLGGGQDPQWTNKTATAAPSATGGIVHVTLQSGAGTTTERLDLVVVLQGSVLLVDDLYCTGTDPMAGDAFAPGWLDRSACAS